MLEEDSCFDDGWCSTRVGLHLTNVCIFLRLTKICVSLCLINVCVLLCHWFSIFLYPWPTAYSSEVVSCQQSYPWMVWDASPTYVSPYASSSSMSASSYTSMTSASTYTSPTPSETQDSWRGSSIMVTPYNACFFFFHVCVCVHGTQCRWLFPHHSQLMQSVSF